MGLVVDLLVAVLSGIEVLVLPAFREIINRASGTGGSCGATVDYARSGGGGRPQMRNCESARETQFMKCKT